MEGWIALERLAGYFAELYIDQTLVSVGAWDAAIVVVTFVVGLCQGRNGVHLRVAVLLLGRVGRADDGC